MSSNLSVNVEIGVSGSFGAVEPVLVLWGCCPRGVGGRCGHHHEERLVIGFILEEVQGHVGLRESRLSESHSRDFHQVI